MSAIWISILISIFMVVLFFVLALCRAAALGDREYIRARMAEQRSWSHSPQRIESDKDLQISPDTQPVTSFGHSSSY
jgi:hypothetical protein